MKTRDFYKERGEIASKLTLDSPEKIDEAFSYSKYIYQNEQLRINNIERKSYIINAVLLIAIVLLTWLFSSLVYKEASISLSILIMFIIIYAIIVYLIINFITYSLNISNY